MADSKVAVSKPTSLPAVLALALKKAWRSGSAGFVAGTMQVLAFMWLRTTMNYQVKNGGTFLATLKKLWGEGGLARLYRGLLPWAIFQAPLSRFGDVAANEMVISVLGYLLPQVPVGVSTFGASMAGAVWRIAITPIDTCKTILQTDGDKGWKILMDKVGKGGPLVLWQGWEGNYIANVVGNYPWFAVMNFLSQSVPVPSGNIQKLIRSAGIGAAASSVSDLVSNSIRVVKTKKQTHENADISYVRAAKEVMDKDGLYGVLFRGLETRILTNVLQGAFFTVMWKAIAGTR
jgi:predicted small secreted protein